MSRYQVELIDKQFGNTSHLDVEALDEEEAIRKAHRDGYVVGAAECLDKKPHKHAAVKILILLLFGVLIFVAVEYTTFDPSTYRQDYYSATDESIESLREAKSRLSDAALDRQIALESQYLEYKRVMRAVYYQATNGIYITRYWADPPQHIANQFLAEGWRSADVNALRPVLEQLWEQVREEEGWIRIEW